MKKGKYVNRSETGLAIYRAIRDSGYSQVQLANKMGVSPVLVSRWATGRHIPDMDSLVLLADTLDMELSELLVRKKKHS